jgi:hypothetical protein
MSISLLFASWTICRIAFWILSPQLSGKIINDMARRIAKWGAVTDTAQWQLSRLEAIGAERDLYTAPPQPALNLSEQQLIRLFDEAATRTLATDDAIYRAAGYNPQPLADNAYIAAADPRGLTKTLTEYRNLTLTHKRRPLHSNLRTRSILPITK